MYASTTILNTLIGIQPGRTSMGYLKLVYLAHGWSSAFGRPVVADLPSLCEFGPAHLSAYDAMRHFRGSPIPCAVPAPGFETAMEVPESDATTHALLQEVIDTHGHLTDIQLSNLCHMEGTPWRLIKESAAWKSRRGSLMTENELTTYFVDALAADEEEKRLETQALGTLTVMTGPIELQPGQVVVSN